jgi:hypothetical protein
MFFVDQLFFLGSWMGRWFASDKFDLHTLTQFVGAVHHDPFIRLKAIQHRNPFTFGRP